MPEIDASADVLLDPFVAATSFVVVRRRSWTDVNGIAQQSESRINALGSVTPTGDSSLIREDGYTTATKTLMVITRLFLRNASEDVNGIKWQPDLIFWQDDYFVVKDLDDYSQFGVGMVKADCMAFEYDIEPPIGNVPKRGILDFRKRRNSGLIGVI